MKRLWNGLLGWHFQPELTKKSERNIFFTYLWWEVWKPDSHLFEREREREYSQKKVVRERSANTEGKNFQKGRGLENGGQRIWRTALADNPNNSAILTRQNFLKTNFINAPPPPLPRRWAPGAGSGSPGCPRLRLSSPAPDEWKPKDVTSSSSCTETCGGPQNGKWDFHN